MMTLEEVETAIYETYKWFSVTAPGVVVQEQGHLARLWALFDGMIADTVD